MPWLIGGILLVLITGTAGWVLGTGAANGKSDANSARDEGFRQGHDLVFSRIHEATARRGFVAGRKRGMAAGVKTGSREGARIGGGNAEIEQAVDSQKAAEAAASSAEAEISARQPNCGIVAAAPSWCPTSDELSGYRAAIRAAREAAEQAAKEKKKGKQGNGRD
jgi:hypothetical protein